MFKSSMMLFRNESGANRRARRGEEGFKVALNLLATLFAFLLCLQPQVSLVAEADQGGDLSGPKVSLISEPGSFRRPSDQSALDELNSIVQQHDSLEDNNKLLAAAIISRLMVDNLTGTSMSNGDSTGAELANQQLGGGGESSPAGLVVANEQQQLAGEAQTSDQSPISAVSGPEATRLKKLMSLLQSYEANLSGDGGQSFTMYPTFPASQAATMKRAAMKMGSYLQAQQQQQQQRHLNNYGGRNSFDFGLGKRPDSSGNILRFGDSSLPVGAGGQPVGQFGKRPSSAHRFDFGLGKRVASPAYPRYDFGLGKRAPSRIRYDFGLGK